MNHRQGNIEAAVVDDLRKGKDSPLIRRILQENQLIKHNYRQPFAQTCICALKGCDAEFSVTIQPNQIIYPKFCEDHRTEYRREQFQKL